MLAVAAGTLVVGVCAAAWIIGRSFSDRYAWSQPVSWIPPILLALPVWAALVLAAGRERKRRVVARRRGVRARVQTWGPAVRGLALVTLSVVMAWQTAFIELGLHRAGTPPAGPGALRLAFWNQSGREVGDITPVFMAMGPDLFVLANRHSDTRTRDIARAFIDTGEAHAAVGWPFDLFSRARIARWGSTSLALEGRSRGRNGDARVDPGWAAFYELETAGGPLTLWAIDLPSDPRIARFPLARRAGEAIASWTGVARLVEPGGGQRSERVTARGFPRPDVIVGDFNIPRGSASLAEFLRASGAGDMRDAFGVAGSGWERTWPRRWPLWAIDHCFVGPRVRAAHFETVDPGMGGHRGLIVEIGLP